MSGRVVFRLCQLAAMSVVAGLLAACSGQFWVNTLVPPWGYTRDADIAYGPLARQRLDVYRPDKPAPGRPVVVFFYGGSWQEGDKAGYRFVGQALASRGITAVVPDYRLYPEVTFPGFVEDGAAAVAWVRAHIDDYGAAPDNLFLAGHSAGAHIAAMLAVAPDYLTAAGVPENAIRGLIGLAGPYDFLPIVDPTLQAIFAPESAWPRTQPINFVDGGEPPMLLLHGEADDTVLPKNTTHMADKVNASGGNATIKRYPNVNHVMLIAPLAAALRFRGDQLDVIADFVRQHVVDSLSSG